jgi:hypothetical protein
MGRKSIILKESQVRRLLENRINEVSAEEIANTLASIECTGEDLKKLIKGKLISYGFEDVRINFLGYSEPEKDLMYIVYTEGPIFVVKARSEKGETPCLNIYDVESYTK